MPDVFGNSEVFWVQKCYIIHELNFCCHQMGLGAAPLIKHINIFATDAWWFIASWINNNPTAFHGKFCHQRKYKGEKNVFCFHSFFGFWKVDGRLWACLSNLFQFTIPDSLLSSGYDPSEQPCTIVHGKETLEPRLQLALKGSHPECHQLYCLVSFS